MDERLEQALEFSNYMVTLNNQKRVLREKYYESLIYYFNGGQFSVTKELISFCQSLIALDQTSTYLVDDNDIPVEIEDLQDFTGNVLNVYWTATNTYHVEYQKIRKNRSVAGLVEYDN